MASLQTLRNKGGIIVAVVIGVALLAFVLGDLLTSGSTLFGGGRNAGEIDGTSITVEQYQRQVNMLTEVVKVTNNSQTITDEQSQMIQNQAWEQLIMRFATEPQLEEIGLTVGLDQMTELVSGTNVSPMIQQFFSNPQTGMFDPMLLHQFLANIEQDQSGSLRLFWDNLQSDVQIQALMTKFKTLIDKGAYITEQQAQFYSELEGANYSVRFVAEPLSAISDSTVSVSDDEIRSFYNAHLPSFKQGESRTVEYVVFDALPTANDYAQAANYIEGLKADFAASTDVEQFASLNSQTTPSTRYYKEGELPMALDTFAFSATPKDLFAPGIEGNRYTLARIADTKMVADSMNFSHILLDANQRTVADSLVQVLKASPAKFGELAQQFSLDQASAINGGEVGTVDPQALFADFSKALIPMKESEVKLVELAGSLHIVKVNSIKGLSNKVKLATIEYDVEASEQTRADVYNKAAQFAAIATTEGFTKSANDSVLSVRNATIVPTQRELQGYESSRGVVSWAYNTDQNAVSEVFELGDSYLVVALKGITEKGTAPVNDVAAQIEAELITRKKSQLAAQKLEGLSIDDAAAKIGKEVVVATDINFNTYIAPEVGFDPSFAGAVVGLAQGQVSKPIEGRAGAYLVEITEVKSNPISSAMIKERLEAEAQQSAFAKAYETVLEGSNIEDTRYKFF